MALDVSKNPPVKVAVYSCVFLSILCHFLCSNLKPGAWGGSVCTGLLNLICVNPGQTNNRICSRGEGERS